MAQEPNSTIATTGAADTPDPTAQPFTEFGATGLRAFGGYLREEFLKDLQGWKGYRVYREMRDNDPIIGAIFFAIEMLLRGVSFQVEPNDPANSDDIEAADFINSCLSDMEQAWPEFVAEALTFLQYGFAVNEIVYKRRKGKSSDPKSNSRFDDGMIGWRKFASRAQETTLHWEFDTAGDAVAQVQLLPTGGPLLRVPLAKCLHFRTVPLKNNPEGRALDPETPIPTPDGWRILDSLQPGDKVFDDEGSIRYVTARADWADRPCYRLTFGDGSEIIADENHQWLTQKLHERATRRPAKLRTTEQIARRPKNTTGSTEHAIAWASPLDYPTQSLLIDPYVLGLWLGDGVSNSGQISCHVDDLVEEVAQIEAAGYTTQSIGNGADGGKGRTIRVYGAEKWARDGFGSLLSALSLRNNKHIPDGYLRGSMTQRLALLAGLMDSDGYVDGSGRCAFDNTNYGLARGVAELVRSLGIGARIQARTTDHGTPSWRVAFTPTWVPFRLSRKAARCRTERQRKFHYVTAAEPVSRRRTVCIEVDSPSHMFLAGDSMVPTHNSIIRNAYTSYYYKKKIIEIEAIGIERDLAGLPIAWVPARIMNKDASPEDQAQLEMWKKIARDTARNEQEGLVLPLAYDKDKNKIFEFTLLSTAGRRAFDTTAIIDRYDHRITATVLADFIVLGAQSSRGSYAQSKNKTDMFAAAIIAFLDLIAGEFNRKAIPDLLELNSMVGVVKMTHGEVERRDLADLGQFIFQTAQAGVLVPDQALEEAIRLEAGLPPPQGEQRTNLNEGGEGEGRGDETAPAAPTKTGAQGQGQASDATASDGASRRAA